MPQSPTHIDVWDVATFGPRVLEKLHTSAALIRDWRQRDIEIESKKCSEPGRWTLLGNEHDKAYTDMLRKLEVTICNETVRSWHYTRLTDAEVGALRADGIYLVDQKTTESRIRALVVEGALNAQQAGKLLAKTLWNSPEKSRYRSKIFWAISHPQTVKENVELLSKWGGEVVHFDVSVGSEPLGLLEQIGRARVLEVAVPLGITDQSQPASRAMAATFGVTLGVAPEFRAFTLQVTRPLGPDAVMAIHTEGESKFARLAQGYPANFSQQDP